MFQNSSKLLPGDCKFNIFSFGSRFSSLWPRPEPYSIDTKAEAENHIDTMEANYGGTDLKEPLEKIFENSQNIPKNTRREVIVLTDGAVYNTEEVLALTRNHCKSGKNRAFSIGIGSGCSTALVNGIARAGMGQSLYVINDDRLQGNA